MKPHLFTPQRGMTLLSVLVALLIFSFGLLSLVGMYARLVTAQTGNEMVTSTQVFGNRFWALLQSNPVLVQAIKNTGNSVTYTQANMNTSPAPLRPLLRDIFTSKYLSLPNASVTIELGEDARGRACEATTPETTICGVTLKLSWPTESAPDGSERRRTQQYLFQVGGF